MHEKILQTLHGVESIFANSKRKGDGLAFGQESGNRDARLVHFNQPAAYFISVIGVRDKSSDTFR